jgi:glycerophosphoryl diester phosphodiesterase
MKNLNLLLLFFVSFSAFSFDWQGHRGARGLYPENSLEGMREALKYPITTLEFDVIVSKDHQVLLSHEPWLGEEACLDLKGQVVKKKQINLYQLSYEDIKKFDCGSKPHPRFPQQKKIKTHKPLLSEVLKKIEVEYGERKLQYNIEIKSTPEDEAQNFQPKVELFTDLVVAEILKHLPRERFFIQSFDFRVLQYLHKKYPELQSVALLEENLSEKKVLKLLGFTPTVYSPYFKFLTKKVVKSWQKRGVKVIPWTVNQARDLQHVKGLGVDGIITDYPDRISEVK